jgi:nitroimidazol reductase NimA-like FMN-containing flavoprotein (pyridoxamine 5'-phosphate oxidase superfamily)
MSTPHTYHLRRIEKDMPGRADQLSVLRGQEYLSLALCHNGEPYLVSLNYVYDEAQNRFYVHSATEGRKVACLRANPRVFGQVVENRGYIRGQCSQSYRSVMFWARAVFVDDQQEKRESLAAMIDRYEPDPAPLKARLLAGDLSTVLVVRLDVESMSGKQGS